MSEQQLIPIFESEEPTGEQKHLLALTSDLESKELEFFNESGKSITERSATFIAVLLGVTVISKVFPSVDLLGNFLAKSLISIALALYLLAMVMGLMTGYPKSYTRYRHNLTRMRKILDEMIARKSRSLQIANMLFGLGMLTLAGLIISFIWVS